MNFHASAALLLALSLTGCDTKDETTPGLPPVSADYDAAHDTSEFKCVYESANLPASNSEVELLYQYGMHLAAAIEPEDLDKIARYFRIAAAHGHYPAATGLEDLLLQQKISTAKRVDEIINLMKHLTTEDIPWAHLYMSAYLGLGYGVKQDIPASQHYLRRAADLGSPEAQYSIAREGIYYPDPPAITRPMLRCAMLQGHVNATYLYFEMTPDNKNYGEALPGLQSAVKSGNEESASFLAKAFNPTRLTGDSIAFTSEDSAERSRRYALIAKFLARYRNLHPQLPDIDQIVPLPPANLPVWDGTYQWKREWDAAITPLPPSDELVARMSREKDLDPNTGRQLSALKLKLRSFTDKIF
ncbi:SEL1-like repeat protein [Pseudomonas sp.]|jgi:hypothetical protein|uniref:SEL1-like repeat protein n=1 Tax=Pseudomonas sp. TaxID=306 RepID=UPI002EDB3F97